jgi:hypothetical protein
MVSSHAQKKIETGTANSVLVMGLGRDAPRINLER